MLLVLLAALARAADVTGYLDHDGDGSGDPLRRTVAPAESPPAGYAATGDDCDDANPAVHPGARETCDAVDSAALCGFPMAQRAGHGYLFLRDPQTWADAQVACDTLGYHMVTLTSADEDLWLDAAADAVSPTKWWLGFNDHLEEGQWVWEDATGGFYTNGYPGEPNDGLGGGTEDCALINRFHPDLGWNDEPCSQTFRGICESGPLLDLYPDAPDIPYDGVDADCDGMDDLDDDGHADPAHGGEDCDDADPTVYPGAPDPAGDGIDADCDGVDGADTPEDTGGSADETDTGPAADTEGDRTDTADTVKDTGCGGCASGGMGAAAWSAWGIAALLTAMRRRRAGRRA